MNGRQESTGGDIVPSPGRGLGPHRPLLVERGLRDITTEIAALQAAPVSALKTKAPKRPRSKAATSSPRWAMTWQCGSPKPAPASQSCANG